MSVYHLSENKNKMEVMIDKKFIKSKILSNYEVMSDDGWVDIKAIHKTIEYDIWEIRTNDFMLECADNHILFNNDYIEVFVKDLKKGDKIITENGTQEVTYLKKTDNKCHMYDLELVEDSDKRYMTNGILSHNTTYIRHLIRKIDKRVIFVSPTMADQFSSPDMIPFLMKYPNSVIVIEDSENIIKSRTGGGNQSVSNLLNISDGILGDCLKFQIICTFNTNKEEIDKALTRKGRLIQSYDFQALEINKTNILLKKLGFKESKKPMILSDIYNKLDNDFLKDDKHIGFKS